MLMLNVGLFEVNFIVRQYSLCSAK